MYRLNPHIMDTRLLGQYGSPFDLRTSETNVHKQSRTSFASFLSKISFGGPLLPDCLRVSNQSSKIFTAHCVTFSVFCGVIFFLRLSVSDDEETKEKRPSICSFFFYFSDKDSFICVFTRFMAFTLLDFL